jgi:hypothetical protein
VLLREAPGDRERLEGWLAEQFAGDEGPCRRDAGMALAWLGDTIIIPSLMGRGNRKDSVAIRRAILSAVNYALDFALNYTLDFAIDCYNEFDHALDLDQAFHRARSLALDLAYELSRALDVHFAYEMDRILTRASSRASALGVGRAFEVNVAFEMDRILIRTSSHTSTLDAGHLDENLNSIEDACGEALLHLESKTETAKLRDLLRSARTTLKALRESTVADVGGLLTFWRAVGGAIRDQEVRPLSWLEAPRPEVNYPRLLELTGSLFAEDAGDVLLVAPSLSRLQMALLEAEARSQAAALLQRWLAADGEGRHGELRRHGSLLLAEIGELAPETLPLLADFLASEDDLTRYRAQIALQRAARRPAGELGEATLLALAQLARDQRLPVQLHADWALKGVSHDEPSWLARWAAGGQTELLETLHRLDAAAWPAFRELLHSGDPPAQEALLAAAGWLLRLTAREEIPQDFASDLLALARRTEPGLQRAALEALGHWPAPDGDWLAALDQLVAGIVDSRAATARWMALARWGVRELELAAPVETRLRGALPDEGAAAALARLSIGRELPGTIAGRGALLARLREEIGGEEAGKPQGFLRALLRAGTDDDIWAQGGYHEEVAALIHGLVESTDGMLAALLLALRQAMEDEDWPARRMALAATAACAPTMAAALNAAESPGELERLLLEGTKDIESFSARRFAITVLSYLEELTPPVLEALLRLCGDVAVVQAGAVAAAGRFQRLHQDFDDDQALVAFVAALQGPSRSRAYAAARLLAALGSAPAIVQRLGLRRHIAALLSETLRRPEARERVYLLAKDGIEDQGTLAQALYAALVQVWGLPA